MHVPSLVAAIVALALVAHPASASSVFQILPITVGGISPDGSTALGHIPGQNFGVPARWTADGGVEPLGPAPADSLFTAAGWSSSDGSVVVGHEALVREPDVDLDRRDGSGPDSPPPRHRRP